MDTTTKEKIILKSAKVNNRRPAARNNNGNQNNSFNNQPCFSLENKKIHGKLFKSSKEDEKDETSDAENPNVFL